MWRTSAAPHSCAANRPAAIIVFRSILLPDRNRFTCVFDDLVGGIEIIRTRNAGLDEAQLELALARHALVLAHTVADGDNAGLVVVAQRNAAELSAQVGIAHAIILVQAELPVGAGVDV